MLDCKPKGGGDERRQQICDYFLVVSFGVSDEHFDGGDELEDLQPTGGDIFTGSGIAGTDYRT